MHLLIVDSDTVHVKVMALEDVVLYSLINMFVCFGGTYLYIFMLTLQCWYLCLSA